MSEYPAAIVGVSISLTIFSTIVVLLRAYVRVYMVTSLGIDDYVTFATAVNFTGRPLGVTGFKLALCVSYLRITSNTTLKFRTVVWSAMAFIGVAQLTSTLVIIFQCSPVAKSWEPHLSGSCLAIYPTWNATAAITIFCDVVTFLLPIPLFVGLQIRPRQKLGLVTLFILGHFTTVYSVMRMVQIKAIAKDRNNSGLVLWAAAELNVGIFLSCIASLLPLIRKFRGSTSSGTPACTPRSINLRHIPRSGSEEAILAQNPPAIKKITVIIQESTVK